MPRLVGFNVTVRKDTASVTNNSMMDVTAKVAKDLTEGYYDPVHDNELTIYDYFQV